MWTRWVHLVKLIACCLLVLHKPRRSSWWRSQNLVSPTECLLETFHLCFCHWIFLFRTCFLLLNLALIALFLYYLYFFLGTYWRRANHFFFERLISAITYWWLRILRYLLRLCSTNRCSWYFGSRSELARQSASIWLVRGHRRRLDHWSSWPDDWLLWVSTYKDRVIIESSWADSASHEIAASNYHVVTHHGTLINASISSLSSVFNDFADFISLVVGYLLWSVELIHQ